MLSSKVKGIASAVVVGLLAVTGTLAFRGASKSATEPYRKPACTVSTTSLCLVSWTRHDRTITATMNSGSPIVYNLGGVDDVVMSANFLCGQSETLAVYAPSTGAVHFVEGWPQGDVATLFAADAGGGQNLGAKDFRLGDFNKDGCADLGVVGQGSVTWLLPAVQSARLVRYEVKL